MWPFLLVLQVSGPALPLPEIPVAGAPASSVTAPALDPPPPPPLPSGFGRIQVGFGPRTASPETSLLGLEGYGGGKLWIELDGGYMITRFGGRHFGAGLWSAIGRWTSPGSGASPSLVEMDYLIGVELLARFGTRDLAVLIAPRVGSVNGSIEIGGEGHSQPAFAWGGQVSAVSSRYHLSASASFLSAVVSPPGELGAAHDLGGLYFSVGGLLDDG
jgi:hypothetical protein